MSLLEYEICVTIRKNNIKAYTTKRANIYLRNYINIVISYSKVFTSDILKTHIKFFARKKMHD